MVSVDGWKISAIRYSTWPMNGFDSQLNWIQIAQRNEQTKEFFEPCEMKRLLILSRLLVTCRRQTFNSLCLLFDILCTLCVCDTIALYAIFTINWSRCDNHSFGRSEPENQYFVGMFAAAVACIQCALCRQTQQLNNVCVCVEILQFAEKSKKKPHGSSMRMTKRRRRSEKKIIESCETRERSRRGTATFFVRNLHKLICHKFVNRMAHCRVVNYRKWHHFVKFFNG